MSNNKDHNLQVLNERYGQIPYISIVSSENDLFQVQLTNPKTPHSSVKILLHGAHVTSFHDGESELLYMSPNAILQKGSKIRGGIPICFPQFGSNGPLPVQHGFARQSDEWKIKATLVNEQGDASVVLQLNDTNETRDSWSQNQFEALYTITLTHCNELKTDFHVVNKNEMGGDVEFTCALHTYFSVPRVEQVGVYGLQGLNYLDKVVRNDTSSNNQAMVPQVDELITFKEEVDRVYFNLKPSSHNESSSEVQVLFDKDNLSSSAQSGVVIELPQSNEKNKGGFVDCVVWNPWIEKAKSLADMPDEDYLKFVCVEAAVAQTAIQLAPSQSWSASMIIKRK